MANLTPRDRAFAHALVLATLRRLGQIDALIAHALQRPLPSRAQRTMTALRLGVAQLAFLGTPAHAAVAETVALVDGRIPLAHKGLMNAVLRRLTREAAALVTAQDAARLNTPDSVWALWARAYGEATAHAIAAAHLVEPPLDLTVKADANEWALRLGAEILPTGSLRLAAAGRIEDLPGFAEGAWWVQDAAAALPARLLGEVRGLRVIDLCAAPGGKTAQLAAAGARVTAVERSPARARSLAANLARLHLEAEIVVADALDWRPETPADAVLLDAPCGASGTIRRHPDATRVKDAADTRALVQAQLRLIEAAFAMVKPGGRLVYAVCSLDPAEGSDVIAAWLGSGAPARRAPIAAAELDGEALFLDAHGDLRTLPCHWAARGGIDGFYAARVVRTA